MRCYYHRDLESIGTCKNCTKGICPKCALECDSGLACSNECERRIKLIDNAVDRSINMSILPSLFWVLVGICFLAGFLFAWLLEKFDWAYLTFIIFGILYVLVIHWRYIQRPG